MCTSAIVAPDGDPVKQYTYDEFGNLSATGEATFDNEVTFTGSITDTSTGLQYMNARFYEPSTGRFISQDSYTGNAYDPWTQHLYSYCGNNPTNFVDPTGHFRVGIYYDTEDPEYTETDGPSVPVMEGPIGGGGSGSGSGSGGSTNSGPAVVFYDPDLYTDQAWDEAARLAGDSSYFILIGIDNAIRFVNAWNSLPAGVREISLIFHGGAHAMSLGEGKINNLAVRNSEYTDDLSNKELEGMKFVDDLCLTDAKINIYACNAGHLNHQDDNLAQEFAKNTTGRVLASDGNVSYYNLLGNYSPRLSFDQSNFYKQGGWMPPRFPTGFHYWD